MKNIALFVLLTVVVGCGEEKTAGKPPMTADQIRDAEKVIAAEQATKSHKTRRVTTESRKDGTVTLKDRTQPINIELPPGTVVLDEYKMGVLDVESITAREALADKKAGEYAVAVIEAATAEMNLEAFKMMDSLENKSAEWRIEVYRTNTANALERKQRAMKELARLKAANVDPSGK